MNTFTTIIEDTASGIEIYSIHDQTGSASIGGFIPHENIPDLIKQLQAKITKKEEGK